MLAISVDDLEDATWVVEQLGTPFPILYDPSTETPRDYNVFNRLGDGLAAPATFILNQDGVIQWRKVGRAVGDRPSVELIIAQLSKIAG